VLFFDHIVCINLWH